MATLNYKTFTLGVEEEYMVLDPKTFELKSHEQKIVQEGQKVIKDKVKAEILTSAAINAIETVKIESSDVVKEANSKAEKIRKDVLDKIGVGV